MNNIILSGGLSNTRLDNNNTSYDNTLDRQGELMDGGNHFDDVPAYRESILPPGISTSDKPRDRMMQELVYKGLIKRPGPRGSTTTNKE